MPEVSSVVVNKAIISNCRELLLAYRDGLLGQTLMPEDAHPEFSDAETRLAYFSLPMALNYQRNSYDLWKAARETYEDESTRVVFDVKLASQLPVEELRRHLIKYKLALQPNKHIDTWQRIAQTVSSSWGSFTGLMEAADHDFLKLKALVQREYKAGFPYLSGPKIFNYWSFILNSYCKANLKSSQLIDIAPDTHITKCSVILGVISAQEAQTLSRDQISERWRNILEGSDINPIDMHPPLWFWSRNGFLYDLPALHKVEK